jgi:predicted naringenin-chalcone synthase
MSAFISGIGTATPPFSIQQEKAAELSQAFCNGDSVGKRRLRTIFARSGVERRGCVVLDGPEQETPPAFYPAAHRPDEHGPQTGERMAMYARWAPRLAGAAAERAMADGRCAPGEVTHLVTVSCTGFASPGVDFALIEELGLGKTVQRVQVGFMGCHAAINALRVARGLVAAEPNAVVLVVAVELCSLHFMYGTDAQRMVGNALFADGAAAVIVRGEQTVPHDLCLNETGSWLFEHTRAAMSWTIGDHGFVMGLDPAIPDLLEQHLTRPLHEWLGRGGVSPDKVAGWLVHPGGPKILDAVERALQLDPQALAPSREILANRGNMSSATVLFVLEQWRQAGKSGPAVLLAFGPGLVGEFALLGTPK